jgi:hypothetical protein
MVKEKTYEQRLRIVQETLENIQKNGLDHEIATKILRTMLQNYLEKGTSYVNKELHFTGSPRKYLVNLRNMRSVQDTIVIKTIEPETDENQDS